MEEQASPGGFRIDGFRQAAEADATSLQLRYEVDQVRQTAPEPIELPYDERVAAPHEAECLI